MNRFFSALILLVSAQFLVLVPGAQAGGGRSSFNPDEIEKAIVDFYRFKQRVDSPAADPGAAAEFDLKDTDLEEIAGALAEMVVVLPNATYNDVVGHLLAEYRQNPENRKAIQLLVGEIHSKVLPELQAMRERHPVLTVIDDVFTVWSVTYSFGFGKGLWKSRGSGLKGLARFKHVVSSVASNLPKGRRVNLALLGGGTTAGIVHAVYQHLETQKLDPSALLMQIQAATVHDMAVQVANLRDELKAVTEDRILVQPKEFLAWAEECERFLAPIEAQLGILYQDAPHVRPEMQPIAQDLQLSKSLLKKIQMRVHVVQMTDDEDELFGDGLM